MDWLKDNWQTIAAVLGFLLAAWKAKKAGTLNAFLARQFEGVATKEDKAKVKVEAVRENLNDQLRRTVVNAGLSSKEEPAPSWKKLLQMVIPLFLVVALSGCKMLESGCPHKEANYRFGLAGKNIIADFPPPTTDGGKARLEAFEDAVEECIRLGNE